MSTFQNLKALVEAAQSDASKFHEKGNRTAGTRLRKAYQQIKILAQQGRAEVTAIKHKSGS